MRVIVFGCGGVGSHLAYMLSKANNDLPEDRKISEIILVDGDEIEEKNIKRQLFFRGYAGENKAEAMSSIISANGVKLDVRNFYVERPIDLAEFDAEHDFAFICTDNMKSKRLLNDFFIHKIIVNCEKDYYELKSHLSRKDLTTWEFGTENGAYSSSQTFLSNIMSAVHAFSIFISGRWMNENTNKSVTISKDMRKIGDVDANDN
jgi:hypothetical protein